MIIDAREIQRDKFSRELNIENKTTRLPLWICVDVSGNTSLFTIESALKEFVDKIYKNENLKNSVDIGISQYAETDDIIRPMSEENIRLLKLKHMEGDGNPVYAIMNALKEINIRKKMYRLGGINCHDASIILFSNGIISKEITSEMAGSCKNKCDVSNSSVIPFLYDNNTHSDILNILSSTGRTYILSPERYDSSFDLIRESMIKMSRSSYNAYNSLIESAKDWNNNSI